MKKFLKKMCLLVMAIALTLCIFTACENEKNDNNDGGNDVTETPNDNQIYYKRVAGGSLQNGGWVMLYDTKNIIYSSIEPTNTLSLS